MSREELLELELSSNAIDRLLLAGHLLALFPGVYRLCGAPDTWEGRALAAQRRIGRQLRRKRAPGTPAPVAALGGHAALRLHGLAGSERDTEIVVTTSARSRSSAVATEHRPGLTSLDTTEVHRIPVTSLPWTAVTAPHPELEGFLAGTIGRGRATHAQLLGAAHRANAVAALDVLRSLSDVPPHVRSRTEARVIDGCVRAGLPRPHGNLPVDLPIGSVLLDLAWEDVWLDVEVDGPHHLEPDQRRSDRLRDRALREEGWTVLRVPVEEVDEDLPGLVERIAHLRALLAT